MVTRSAGLAHRSLLAFLSGEATYRRRVVLDLPVGSVVDIMMQINSEIA